MITLVWTRDHVHLEEAYHDGTSCFNSLLINDVGDTTSTGRISNNITDA